MELTFSANGNAKWKPHQMAVQWFLPKLNTTLPHDPTTVLLGSHQNELQTCSCKILHIYAYSSWVGSRQKWETVKRSIHMWWSMAYYPAKKKQYWFSGGSDGKESACNAGDHSSISGLGRSPGEGNGNPFQYSCLEDPMDGGAWQATVHGVTKSQTQLSNFTSLLH